MKKEPSKPLVRAWARLLKAHTQALGTVEGALKAAGFPPLAWYDVLLELDRVAETGMRPYELERELLLPQYGLSRLLDRIEAAGYLERRPCDSDGRGSTVHITKAGRDLRRRMWPTYAAAIGTAMGTRLSESDAAQLDALLGKLLGAPRA